MVRLQADRTQVVVASYGRPEHVAFLLGRLAAQTAPPERILLAVARAEDAPTPEGLPFAVEVVLSERGSCRQRNAALDHADFDAGGLIVFFDDDFVPSRTALAGAAAVLAAAPELGGLTGELLADGVRSGGLDLDQAARLVDAHDAANPSPSSRIGTLVEGLYGCNMAFRAGDLRGVRFDERLPLYGWQEDIDFSARVRGAMARSPAMVGVHCGARGGRERNGALLGYSQIANPAYLAAKGTMSRGLALRHGARNLLANHLRLLAPEPWIDRRGRAAGNRRALLDWLRGRMAPERILERL